MNKNQKIALGIGIGAAVIGGGSILLFKNSSVAAATVPISFPHPVEIPNLGQTMENADVAAMLQEWVTNYNVPAASISYFLDQVVVTLSDTITAPAETYVSGGVTNIVIQPEYLSPGIIAYEEAHVSYGLLTDAEKTAYQASFQQLVTTNDLLIGLFAEYPYELTSDTNIDPRIAGHAEIYRCLCGEIPSELIQFYPGLF